MTNEKQLKELFKYIEQKWDVAVESSHKTDIKRIFGGVLCEDIMNDTLHEVKADPELNEIDEKIKHITENKLTHKDCPNKNWYAKDIINVYTSQEDKKHRVFFYFGDKEMYWQDYETLNLSEWQPVEPEQSSSQAKLDNSFDRDRFERLFCAVVASGQCMNIEEEIEQASIYLKQLDAYYADKNN